VALDLEERKARVLAPQIRAAAVGPDGTIYAVDSGRSVLQISRRTTTRFPGTLNQQPSSIAAAAGGSALAIETGRVAVIGPDGTRRVATPRGPVATTYWGDLLAVGTDSGVVFFDPQSRRQPARVPASARTRALLFSPSGHRLYAAGGDHELLVIDRFGHTVLRRIQLPGTASALRVDFFGNWLLARATGADSVWVIDLDAERVIGSVATTWAADLPAVAAPRTLILREHRDVVARDLASAALTETGRVKDGASDVWVAVSWAPAPAAAEPTADTARVATTAPTPPPAADTGATTTADTAADRAEPPAGPTDARLYLQVSSSRNPSWADDLAGKLRAAGLQPTVLKPAGSEETYRVVLGPFPTREAAEETGRRLGMPSFVITAQGDSGR
jgi:cell division septation protein DedD